jgi:RNA polymerase sigma factor (sigma-70 family)
VPRLTVDRAANPVKTGRRESDLPFADLLQIVLEPAYRLACGMLHDPQLAEDVVQEAALKAWRKQGQLRKADAARPWFLSIVANECRNTRRSRWWSVLKSADSPAAEDASADSVLRGLEVRQALRSLDENKRLALVLHWYLDLPLEEIALITGSSVHAVESRLYRGIQELRRVMEASDAD